VLAIAAVMVAIVATSIAIGRGDMRSLVDATAGDLSYAVATGVRIDYRCDVPVSSFVARSG
jgi:hypothetical protein